MAEEYRGVSMRNDQSIEKRYRARRKRREALQRRRHKRSALIGVCAGVLLLLSGSFVLRHFMNSSSAVDTHAALATSAQLVQDTQAVSKENESVSVEYKTRVEIEEQKQERPQEKEQHDGYTDRLDTFLRISRDTTLFTRDSTKSHVVAPLAAGTTVETYGTNGEWTKVTSKGRTGYVRNVDLVMITDATLCKTVEGKVIVNATYRLPEDYETVFHPDAEAGLKVMLEAMQRDGVQVEVATTYRGVEEEKKELVLRGNPANVPQPGHAVFQTGYGVQFNAPNTDPRIENHFENTKQFQWLKAHAQEYGFVLRYPKGSESITGYRADPTIFYYVGVEDASLISNDGLTMEVFYGVN